MPQRLEKVEVNRRDFLGLAGLWSAGLAILTALIGTLRLPKPRVSPEASAVFRIGMPAEFPAGTVKVFPDYNVRVFSGSQGVAAISLVCTHLGCIVKETQHGFDCPCHGSRYDREGKVLAGPAPRPLRWLAVSQAPDGNLLVDSAAEVRAGEFYQG